MDNLTALADYFDVSLDYLTDDIKHAMNMAINKQLIVDQLLYGHGTVMKSVWPVSHS